MHELRQHEWLQLEGSQLRMLRKGAEAIRALLLPPMREIDRLRAVNDPGFPALLIDLLKQDYSVVFEFLRSQKLLLKFRDIHALSIALENIGALMRTSELRSKELSSLRRHMSVSLEIQKLYSKASSAIASLQIWGSDFESVAEKLLQVVEVKHHAAGLTSLTEGRAQAKYDDFLALLEQERRGARDLADQVCLILTHHRTVGATPTTSEVPIESLRTALELAEEWDTFTQAVDLYSFLGAPLKITDSSMSLGLVKRSKQQFRDISTLRARAEDTVENANFERIAAKFLQRFIATSQSEVRAFPDYLSSSTGLAAFEAASELEQEWLRKNCHKASRYLDLDKPFKAGTGKITFRNYLKAWATLTRLNWCAFLWNAQHNAPGEIPVIPKLDVWTIMHHISKSLPMSEDPEKYANLLTSPLPTGSYDLFLRPLIRIAGSTIMWGPSFVETARVWRNLFLLASECGLDVSKKGAPPVRRLAQLLTDHGFSTGTDVNIVRSDGSIATDLDVVAYKDATLFAFQAKVLVPEDSHYELWKAERVLCDAASQMAAATLSSRDTLSQLEQEFGPIQKVVPIIISNLMTCSGQQLDGCFVTDFDYIEEISQGFIALPDQQAPTKVFTHTLRPIGDMSAAVFEGLLRKTAYEEFLRPAVPEFIVRPLMRKTFKLPVQARP
jgi:hypothetical protein